MDTCFIEKIKKDFNRAAYSYDQYAFLQRKVSDYLFSKSYLLNGSYGVDKSFIALDIGCGTGYFHEILRRNKKYIPLVQSDISIKMCDVAHLYSSPIEYGGTYTCNADMHNLPFESNLFSFVFSSMSLQWAYDIQQSLQEINRVLANKGKFALSFVADGSLIELKESFILSGYTPPIYSFYKKDQIDNFLKKAGIVNYDIFEDKITMKHENFYALLKSIKAIGAGYKDSFARGIKGKNYFKNIENNYKSNFCSENIFPATWNIVYVVGER